MLAILGFYVLNNSLLFVYVNPYTNIEGMKYSAKQVYAIGKILDNARNLSRYEKIKYRYKFFNQYGSGYMTHNPIPNDLDLETDVYLGEFEYDGKNGKEVANRIMDSIESFSFAFNYCLNSSNDNIYIDQSPFEQLSIMAKERGHYVKSIVNSLDYVISGKNYIKYVSRIFNNKKYIYRVDYPYYMDANEILLTGYPVIKMFSDDLIYSPNQKRYLREITLIPTYSITLKYNGKSIPVDLVPESYFGARMHIKRRFFTSSVFTNKYSEKYLKTTGILHDEKQYFFYRMLSFKRHISETENIIVAGIDRPLKLIKRLMQTADMMHSQIGDDMYNEIAEYAGKYLNNPDIQLLNECSNIYSIVYTLQQTPNLLAKLNELNKTHSLYETANDSLNQLYARGVVDKKYLDIMKKYHDTKLKYLPEIKNASDVYLLGDDELCKAVKDATNSAIRDMITDVDKIDKYVAVFNNIMIKAGYHRIFIYWLDAHTLGILKDDFTNKITNLESFAKYNDLTAMEYKFINKEDIPKSTMKYEVWVRYNPSPEEEKEFVKLKQSFDDDKKLLKVKKYRVFFPKRGT